jgi:hypothetical protein
MLEPVAAFTVTFAPTGAASGTHAAAIHSASNSVTANPFDIALTGLAFSTTTNTDDDGLTDWGEYQLAALGFHWQVSQAILVSALNNGAGSVKLFPLSQLRA